MRSHDKSSNRYNYSAYKIILFSAFFEMFSFFGIISILVLYTSNVLLYKDESSYLIYSVFLTLFCGLPIIGGLLIDKCLNLFESLMIGCLLMILGNIFLIFSLPNTFFLGLSSIICGASLFKPICTHLIGKLTEEHSDIEQENAFSRFYVIINLGAMIAPILYGIVGNYYSLNYCFLLGAIGISISSFLVYKNRKYFSILNTNSKGSITGIVLIKAMLLLVTAVLFYHPHFDKFVLLTLVFLICMFMSLYVNQSNYHRKTLLGLLYLLLFCMLFFTASLQVGSTLTLYIDRFVQRNIYQWSIPTAFFTSLNPLFLVVSAPIFKCLWKTLSVKQKEPNTVFKLSLGLALGGVAFICFWLSSMNTISTNQHISLIIIVLGYFFLGSGEMCLSPAILHMINKYTAKTLANTMMGSWYLFMAFSGYLGGFIDRLLTKLDKSSDFNGLTHSLSSFQYTFVFFSIMCIILSCILLLFSKKIMKFFKPEVYLGCSS